MFCHGFELGRYFVYAGTGRNCCHWPRADSTWPRADIGFQIVVRPCSGAVRPTWQRRIRGTVHRGGTAPEDYFGSREACLEPESGRDWLSVKKTYIYREAEIALPQPWLSLRLSFTPLGSLTLPLLSSALCPSRPLATSNGRLQSCKSSAIDLLSLRFCLSLSSSLSLSLAVFFAQDLISRAPDALPPTSL